MTYSFNFRDVFNNIDVLLVGMGYTLQLSGITMVLGLVIGIAMALARTWGAAPLRWLAVTYVEVIRNTPLLVQLFIIFFGLPSLGLRLSADQAAVIALSVNLGAYATEIVRAGIEAIHKSQVEAGLSLGMSRLQVFRYVVLFPALRVIYPALASQFILLLLATSIVSLIAARDLFHMAAFLESRTFRSFEIYLVVTGLYLAMALVFRAMFAVVYRFAFERR